MRDDVAQAPRASAGPGAASTSKLISIRAPLTRLARIEPLVAAGADEFYCGFAEEEGAHEVVGTNHRQGPKANFIDRDELARAVERCHELERSVSLVLNARSMYGPSEEAFLGQLELARDLGVDSVVVGSMLGLLLASGHEARGSVQIHCGVNTGLLNRGAFAEAKALGATRVTLSRHFLVDEIKGMAEDSPDMAFEVFALNGRCGYYDAYCGFHYDRVPGQRHDFSSGCLFVRDASMPRFERDACSACRVVALMDQPGVVAAKIVGRDFDPAGIEGDVRFLREALDAARDQSPEERLAGTRAIRARRYGAPCPTDCAHGE